jgi:DNA polymerase-1
MARNVSDSAPRQGAPQQDRFSRIFADLARKYIMPAASKDAGLSLVFDLESDGLLADATKAHCIVIGDPTSGEITEYGPDRIADALKHLARANRLSGHNVQGFDLPLLKRLYGWAPPAACEILDTLIICRTVFPHLDEIDDQAAAMSKVPIGTLRGRYSLEAWGFRLGKPKIGADIDDWSKWTPEMQERCVGDVRLTMALWRFLQPDGQSRQALELEHRTAAICNRLEIDGVPFDVAAAEQLRDRLEARCAELEIQVREQLPEIKNLNSRKQISDQLEARGYKSGRRTEKTGQLVIDDELLESLSALYPEFEGLAEYLILKRLLGQLSNGAQALLGSIGDDGRIHGGIIPTGTPHFRAKHLRPNLAQVPNPKKGGSPYAAEFRALFRHPSWVMVACDQSNLQDRAFAHYLAAYDGGAYAHTFANGIDQHWRTAVALGLVPGDAKRDKESKVHTAIRESAKRFRYGFLYGAGAKRAGEILSDTERAVRHLDPGYKIRSTNGKTALAKFMAATPGLAQLRNSLEAQFKSRNWLPGLDGRRVPGGAEYKCLNRIVTAAEAVICKRWLVQVYDELHERFRYGWDGDVVLMLWIHDELVCSCKPEIAEQVGEIMVRHAKEAGEHYGFKVPLDAEYKIGRDWAGTPIGDAPPPSSPPSSHHDATVGNERNQDDRNSSTILTEASPTVSGIETISAGQAAPPFEKALPKKDPQPRSNGNGTPYPGNGRARADDGNRNRDGYPHGERDDDGGGHQAGIYIYCRANGEPYLAVRRIVGKYGKQFPQYHWDGAQWQKGKPTGPKIPYRLPELIEAPIDDWVLICAGEKDADTAAALGFVATTNPEGETPGKWVRELNAWLIGRKHVAVMEDNDDTGRAHALEVVHAIRSIGVPDIRIITFRELPEHGDLSDWVDLGRGAQDLRERIEAAKPFRPEPQPAPIRDWDGRPAPELEYAVPDRFPMEDVALFSGEGGHGKSTLLQQLCVAHALGGCEWLDSTPRHGPVIYLECEDSLKVLHWRLIPIANHYGVSLTNIADAAFQMFSLADEENAILATAPDKSGIVRPTPLYDWLYEMAGDIKPVMIGIASTATVFAGNENVRTEVQQFIQLLRRVTRVSGGGLLLISHPSLTGIGDGSASHAGLSGTTQWHNAVRSRATMRISKSEDGLDTGMREIKFHKNQYGPLSSSCFVRWQNGMFLPVEGMSMDAAERAVKAEEVFITLLKKIRAQGREVNHKAGSTYAPKIFAEQPDAQGITKREFKAAMERLLDAGAIKVEDYGKASRPAYRLVLVGEG